MSPHRTPLMTNFRGHQISVAQEVLGLMLETHSRHTSGSRAYQKSRLALAKMYMMINAEPECGWNLPHHPQHDLFLKARRTVGGDHFLKGSKHDYYGKPKD